MILPIHFPIILFLCDLSKKILYVFPVFMT